MGSDGYNWKREGRDAQRQAFKFTASLEIVSLFSCTFLLVCLARTNLQMTSSDLGSGLFSSQLGTIEVNIKISQYKQKENKKLLHTHPRKDKE
jgi:hypothetical protein